MSQICGETRVQVLKIHLQSKILIFCYAQRTLYVENENDCVSVVSYMRFIHDMEDLIFLPHPLSLYRSFPLLRY